jgi:hypothetical protein
MLEQFIIKYDIVSLEELQKIKKLPQNKIAAILDDIKLQTNSIEEVINPGLSDKRNDY